MADKESRYPGVLRCDACRKRPVEHRLRMIAPSHVGTWAVYRVGNALRSVESGVARRDRESKD